MHPSPVSPILAERLLEDDALKTRPVRVLRATGTDKDAILARAVAAPLLWVCAAVDDMTAIANHAPDPNDPTIHNGQVRGAQVAITTLSPNDAPDLNHCFAFTRPEDARQFTADHAPGMMADRARRFTEELAALPDDERSAAVARAAESPAPLGALLVVAFAPRELCNFLSERADENGDAPPLVRVDLSRNRDGASLLVSIPELAAALDAAGVQNDPPQPPPPSRL